MDVINIVIKITVPVAEFCARSSNRGGHRSTRPGAVLTDLQAESLRDALYEHEMFEARTWNTAYAFDSMLALDAALAFAPQQLEAGLIALRDEGLAQRDGPADSGAWRATPGGLAARERRWQARGRRHPCLISGDADPADLIVALIAAGGSDLDVLAFDETTWRTLCVYLDCIDESRRTLARDDLIKQGLVGSEEWGLQPEALRLTGSGRRHYLQIVVPRLGLCPPATILAAQPSAPPALPFDDLGLAPAFADNLRFRWEEAGRCMSACAWLAATALFGSIIEVVLLDWLGRDQARTKAAAKAPRDRTGQAKTLDRWTLAELITVAAELNYLDASHARHAQALRESRNLIHPDRHIRERSTPDSHLAGISQQVVRAVLDSLAHSHARSRTDPAGVSGGGA